METPRTTTESKHLTGSEPFHQRGGSLSTTVGDFWRWACSDLLGSPLRGVLAEFLVAKALGCAPPARQLSAKPDLTTPGGLRVEVLSASFLKEGADEPAETATFAPASPPKTQTGQGEADVYIFCLLKHRDKKSVDPLDVTQWQFYVLPGETLSSRENACHSLELLVDLRPEEANFWTLPTAVNRVAKPLED